MVPKLVADLFLDRHQPLIKRMDTAKQTKKDKAKQIDSIMLLNAYEKQRELLQFEQSINSRHTHKFMVKIENRAESSSSMVRTSEELARQVTSRGLELMTSGHLINGEPDSLRGSVPEVMMAPMNIDRSIAMNIGVPKLTEANARFSTKKRPGDLSNTSGTYHKQDTNGRRDSVLESHLPSNRSEQINHRKVVQKWLNDLEATPMFDTEYDA